MSKLLQFPASYAAISEEGRVGRSWYVLFRQFFGRLGGEQGQPAESVSVGSSPYAYTMPANGILSIDGGTVSSVSFERGTTSVTGASFMHLRTGDIVTVTYSVAPTMTFFPD